MALRVADLMVVLSADPRRFNKEMDKVINRTKQMGAKLQSIGQGLSMRVGLPLAAVGGIAIKMAADFDDAMNRIVSLVGIARSQVNSWREGVRALALDTGRSATELAEAMFYITSAGARGKTAMDILVASAHAAKIGLGDTKSVAFAATSAVNAFGEGSLDAETAVATLVSTIREGNLDAATLAPTLGRVMATAANLGVEFHELGAAYAAMTRLGVNAEESATSLRSIMVTMMKPSKQAREAMNEMGVSFEELRRQLEEEGLLAVLFRLKGMLASNEEGMTAVFKNVRALSGVLNLVGENAEKTKEIFASLAKTTREDLTKASAEAEKSWKVRLGKAFEQFRESLLVLGEELLPVVVPLIEGLGEAALDLADAFKNLSPEVKILAIALGGVAIAAGPLTYALGGIMKILPMITGAAKAGAVAQAGMTGHLIAAGAAAKGASVAFTTLGGAAGLFGAAIGGWMLGRVISDLTGLTEATSGMNDELSESSEYMTKNLDKRNVTIEQLTLLKEKLGDAAHEWDVEGAQIDSNTRALARYNMEAGKIIHQEFVVKGKEERMAAIKAEEERLRLIKERGTAEQQVFRAKLRMNAEALAAEEKFKKEAREKLLTEEDVRDQLQQQVESWKTLRLEGYNMNQIVRAHGKELEELTTLADEYGIKLPLGAKELTKELKERGHGELSKALNTIDQMQQSLNLTPGKLIEGFEVAGESIVAVLSNGLNKGAEDGVGHVKRHLVSLSDYAQDNPLHWPVVLDVEGDVPGGGSVPGEPPEGGWTP